MTPPPSPPAPVMDAEVEWRRKLAAAEPIREGDVFLLALIDDRARDKKRIGKLERRLRHIRSWAADTDRALLGEVPDGRN